MKKYLWVEDGFAPQAKALRQAFDERFADPRASRSDRFVWDYWHVPDQYTLLRTPAEHFFPRKTYAAFLQHLGHWALTTLGCRSITPPWLSYYVDGCGQELHSDVPHGPWAFVFSLTPEPRRFSGGETLLLRPEVLDYWPNFPGAGDRELPSFVQRIPSRFNRLVVFDPRIPHGVTRVRGTQDPREARLALHGWFSDPAPYLEGGLSAGKVAPVLDHGVARLLESISALGLWHGVLSLRISVRATGEVSGVKVLADTLVPVDADPRQGARLRAGIRGELLSMRFPKAAKGTEITLPLLFR
jgi:hypothetical protein